MKLLRHGPKGQEKPALLHTDGTVRDLSPVLDRVGSIPGIDGILAVKDGKIGLWGHLPQLVRNQDAVSRHKITRDLRSDFQG